MKQLDRLMPCTVFKIKAPIWGGGLRRVGLATYKVGPHNEIRIEKKDANGDLLYPQPFYISGSDVRSYPIEPVPSHPSIKLHIIPIADLEVLERI